LNTVANNPDDERLIDMLAHRIGPDAARQRLGIELDHEARVFGYGINFFHPENWFAMPSLLTMGLKACGLYGRGKRNAVNVRARHNIIARFGLPRDFHGFRILHLSDLHVDSNSDAMARVAALIAGLSYDLCVLTGDYRGKTWGPYEATLRGLEKIRRHVAGEVFGVLGNHDSIRMVPGLEQMGIRMLLNEAVTVGRGGSRIHLAGIDDAHYFRAEDFAKTASSVPHGEFSILLSHTPEVYRQAAGAGFDVMLSGHTHGGQICLPGGVPITLDSVLPRRMGSGPWRYGNLDGYTSSGAGTSIVPVRLNCPPEITLHELACA
jgi:uncharacterized protein